MVQSHLALVHQPVGQMQEIALGDADAEGIMSVDALLTAVGIEPLVGGHAVGETAQQPPPLIVDGGDVGIDDGTKLCDAGLMGQHIDRAAETAEGLHHRQITGNVHDGGQLEALQLLRPQQAVCQIGSAVGGDKAHLPGRMARQGQQAETDAAKVLDEVRRVLKDGGNFICTFYTKSYLDKLPYCDTGFDKFTPQQVRSMARERGFHDVKVKILSDCKAYCLVGTKIEGE